MPIPKGYAGKVMIIDLSKLEARILPTDEFWREYDIDPRLWLGGDGVIAKILWKDFPQGIDPMSPENEIIVATGPWTATAAPQAGRAMLGCISPETGGFSSGSFGWYFPATLKYAGFDIMIVRGKAAKPTYVFIDDGEVAFRDASHIWGKVTGETVKAIRDELGERYEGEIRVLSISIAGERLVKYAVACGDATSCPGRSGGGAIMGSKNLKAVAVRGSGEVQIHSPKPLVDSSYEAINRFFREEPTLQIWQKHGCSTGLATVSRWPLRGTLLADNRAAADSPHLKNVGCLNCFNPCYHWLQLKQGKHAGVTQIGGHMTFLTTLLRNLNIDDFNEWVYYERLMQELGLDPASFSMNFTFAVDLFERGLLTPDHTDGVVLKRGDPDLVWDVAERVARRQGKLGDLLAEAQGDLARRIGGKAVELAPAVKGKPSIQSDPRIQALIWSMGYLTSPRGGDWLRTHNTWELAFLPETRDTYPEYIGKSNLELYQECVGLLDMPAELKKQIFGDPPRVDVEWIKSTKGKMLFMVWTENLVCLFNSLVTCMFGAATQFMMVAFGPSTYAEILNKITGWDVTYDELMLVGERVFNLQRAFNYRLKGWDYRNDRFNDKRSHEPAVMGIYKSKTVPWDEMLQEYYAIRGWTKEGVPTPAKMNQLNMHDVTNTLSTLT
jgi:aldehyde:ferredoxin oxidoreductase